MSGQYLVYVVDDMSAVVDLACRYLQSAGMFDCRGFNSPAELLEEFQPCAVDCIVADLKMPGIDGGQLQQRISQQDPLLSFVFVSGYADVKTAVHLMEQGALTLLEKPFTLEELVAAVQRGSQRTRQMRIRQAERLEAASRLRHLSEEERAVLNCIVSGLPNKAISHQLAISPRTVDRRRRAILQKMQADSVAELVAVVTRAQIEDG